MFNTYHAGNTTLNVNAVSGTLVKNYKDSFFYNFHLKSPVASTIFNEKRQYIRVDRKEKDVVVIQCMILANEEFLTELMWKEDFDKMFEGGGTDG